MNKNNKENMKQSFQLPTPEVLESLIGTTLFEVWMSPANLSSKNMKWSSSGIPEEKHGLMNTNTVEVGKHFVPVCKRKCFGFMVILGKDERAKFESEREFF